VIALFPHRCPICGESHYGDPTHGRIEPVFVPVRPIGLSLRKAVAHAEAMSRSRLLQVAPMSEPVVRGLHVAVRDPKRVHVSRCPMRRPRLSLLARVKAELSRRRV